MFYNDYQIYRNDNVIYDPLINMLRKFTIDPIYYYTFNVVDNLANMPTIGTNYMVREAVANPILQYNTNHKGVLSGATKATAGTSSRSIYSVNETEGVASTLTKINDRIFSNSGYSISFWFKYSNLVTMRAFNPVTIHTYDPTGSTWQEFSSWKVYFYTDYDGDVSKNKIKVQTNASTTVDYQAAPSGLTDDWHHFTFTAHQDTTKRIFLDGVKVTEIQIPHVDFELYQFDTYYYYLGMNTMNTSISDLIVFDYAITEDQANFIYLTT